MRRSGTGSGGGIGSNKVVHRSAPKVEPRVQGVRPAHVAQIGTQLGTHVTQRGTPVGGAFEPRNTKAYSPPVGPTDNVAAVGVGGGRDIHRSGAQGQHGPVAGQPKPEGRDILSEFGPESRGRR